MESKKIIKKLKDSDLKGKGGAGFPTGLKWEMVKEQKADKKYIVCNGAEGEPGVFKDGFILKNHLDEVVKGIKLALKTFKKSSAYFYLRSDYFKKFKKKLEKETEDLPVTLFKKTGGYLGGEETCLINVIEGKMAVPEKKPPFPPQSGIKGCPTLVNNVETFYHIAKILEGDYKKERFYSISGDVKNEGVFKLPEDISVEKVLKETNNFPNFNFFVQNGGGAVGKILLPSELDETIKGAGGIVVYNRRKVNPFSLMEKWVDFFLEANCDKCVPCREGVLRIAKLVKGKKLDEDILEDLFFVMENTSFCTLGKEIVVPFRSLIEKVINE